MKRTVGEEVRQSADGWSSREMEQDWSSGAMVTVGGGRGGGDEGGEGRGRLTVEAVGTGKALGAVARGECVGTHTRVAE